MRESSQRLSKKGRCGHHHHRSWKENDLIKENAVDRSPALIRSETPSFFYDDYDDDHHGCWIKNIKNNFRFWETVAYVGCGRTWKIRVDLCWSCFFGDSSAFFKIRARGWFSETIILQKLFLDFQSSFHSEERKTNSNRARILMTSLNVNGNTVSEPTYERVK